MKKNVIFMVNLPEARKPGRTDPYQYSIRSWEAYAEKYGCHFFLLTQRIYPEHMMNANWHKILALELMDSNNIEYNKVLIVDGDTIIHPDAPNIFERASDKLNVVQCMGSFDWILRSIENYSKFVFDGFSFPFTQYFNSGVLVVNQSHKKLLAGLISLYDANYKLFQKMQARFGVGTDQPVWNFWAHMNLSPAEINFLPISWNLQEMPRLEILDKKLTFTKFGHLYHFNGINPHSAVGPWMEYTYNQLYKG